MGVNKKKQIPCGFCFVEYVCREDAARAIELLNKSTCDGRMIRVDWDIGFSEGRQFGRGKMGGQVRDEMRTYEDKDRSAPGEIGIVAGKRTKAEGEVAPVDNKNDRERGHGRDHDRDHDRERDKGEHERERRDRGEREDRGDKEREKEHEREHKKGKYGDAAEDMAK